MAGASAPRASRAPASPASLLLAAALAAIVMAAGVPAPASAGTRDDPEVRDPAGDAGPAASAPAASAAFAWADIVSAWLEGTDDGLVVRIATAGGEPAPGGTVAVAFRSAGMPFVAGYTEPAGAYGRSGGFLCEARSDGTPASPCQDAEASLTGGVTRIVVPRATIGAQAYGASIHSPHAWSDMTGPSGRLQLDATEVGRDAVLRTPCCPPDEVAAVRGQSTAPRLAAWTTFGLALGVSALAVLALGLARR